jgi:hypothetical protein
VLPSCLWSACAGRARFECRAVLLSACCWWPSLACASGSTQCRTILVLVIIKALAQDHSSMQHPLQQQMVR